MKNLVHFGGLLVAFLIITYVLVRGPVLAKNEGTETLWYSKTIAAVDPDPQVYYSYTSLEIDSTGVSHICYRGPGLNLQYATNAGGGWSVETVDSSSLRAWECAIAIDSSDLPHISYSARDTGNEDLWYANKDAAGAWHTEFVVGTFSIGMQNDITLDSNDQVHISHRQWAGADLMYSTKENGVWQTETLVSGGVSWAKTAVATDSQDNVHIVYRTPDNVMHITNQSGTWGSPSIVMPCKGGGCAPGLAIDGNDTLHVIYSTADAFFHAINMSGTWQSTPTIANVATAGHHSIAVDQEGFVHVSYYDNINGSLNYANNLSGSWVSDSVDNTGDVGLSNAIAVDPSNYPHISYRDNSMEVNSRDIWGSSPTNIYTVSDDGTIYRFDGTSWVSLPLDTAVPLNGIWGSSTMDIYVVGNDGKILHYNGGTWVNDESGTTNNLHDVWGNSPKNNYAVGTNGTILHNDGKTWKSLTTGTSQHLNGVWGSSDNDIFAVGGSDTTGYILHYDGNTWSEMDPANAFALNKVWGSSATNVYAVGSNGTVIHYDGISWQAIDIGTDLALHDIWGGSPNDIFVIGDDGFIKHFDGQSWTSMTSGTNMALRGIWGNSTDHILTIGDAGIGLRYDGSKWLRVFQPQLKYAKLIKVYTPIIMKPSIPPLMVANFDTCNNINNLGGEMGAAYNPPDFMQESYVSVSGGGCEVKLDFEIENWAAFWMKLQSADLSTYKTNSGVVSFDIMAGSPVPGGLKVEIKRLCDPVNGCGEILICRTSNISAQAKTINLPIDGFYAVDWAAPISNWGDVEELVFTFEHFYSGGSGVVYLDDIEFSSTATTDQITPCEVVR